MLILRTDFDLSSEAKEALKSEVMKHTGEACIVLDRGLRLEQVLIKKEQPLWRRLFRLFTC